MVKAGAQGQQAGKASLIPVVKVQKNFKKEKRKNIRNNKSSTSNSTHFSGDTPTYPEVRGVVGFHFRVCALLGLPHKCEYSQSCSEGTKGSFRQ